MATNLEFDIFLGSSFKEAQQVRRDILRKPKILGQTAQAL